MENTLPKQSSTYRDLWQLMGLVGIAIFLTALALWMISSQFSILPGDETHQGPSDISQVAFAEETGIRIVRVAIIAGGGIIDLQYQVVDPDKAVIVHDDEYPPGIIIETTGQIINTPYHDHSEFEAHTAVTYHELIMNPGGVLRPGTEITVLIGEAQLEHVMVQ